MTVKQAAEILRIDERSVRERLSNGQLKGEKKNIGLREKWFVYHGALEAALAKENRSDALDGVIADDVTDVDSVNDADQTDFRTPDDDGTWLDVNRDKLKAIAEEIVKPLMERIENQSEVIFEQKRMLEEQERQLRLLPDLRKQAEQKEKDAELLHLENEAFRKQLAAIEEERLLAEARAAAYESAAQAAREKEAQKPWWQKLLGS